jgi:hypothetical protein
VFTTCGKPCGGASESQALTFYLLLATAVVKWPAAVVKWHRIARFQKAAGDYELLI